MNVVGHEAEGDLRWLGIRCRGRGEEGDERHRDGHRSGRHRERCAEAEDRSRHDQRGDDNKRRRCPHRRLQREEGVKAERGGDERDPAEGQRDDGTGGRSCGNLRRAEDRGRSDNEACGEDQTADERHERLVPPEQRRTDRQRARAEETVRTEPHQGEGACRETEPEHDLADLRRARWLRSETKARRERDLRAVRRASLSNENERRSCDQRERADRAGTGPLTRGGERREARRSEYEHRDDDDPDRDRPRKIDHWLRPQRRVQREVDDERDRQRARERGGRLTGPRAVEEREPPHPRRERDDRERKVQPVASRCGEPERGDAEDHSAETDGAPRPETRGDDQREEGRGEYRQGRDGEVGIGGAEERLLERRAERAEIRE